MVVQTKLTGALKGMSSSKPVEEIPSVAIPRMWDQGVSIGRIAEAVRLDPVEVRKVLIAAGRSAAAHCGASDFNWTDGAIEILKSMVADGHSAAEIARALGDGPTRSAVLGKIKRLRARGQMPALPMRQGERAIVERPKAATAAPRASYVPPAPIVEEDPLILDDGSHVTILTVSDKTCRWPIGDPCDADFHFCGRTPVSGKNYCEFHARRAFQPPQQNRANLERITQ